MLSLVLSQGHEGPHVGFCRSLWYSGLSGPVASASVTSDLCLSAQRSGCYLALPEAPSAHTESLAIVGLASFACFLSGTAFLYSVLFDAEKVLYVFGSVFWSCTVGGPVWYSLLIFLEVEVFSV